MSLHEEKPKNIEFIEESTSQFVQDGQDESEQAREEKALVRKIDLTLLPVMWIMYLLSYMDVSYQCPTLSITLASSVR